MLAAFAQACPHVDVRLLTYDLTQPAAGLLDHSTDVAFVRPPLVAEGVTTRVVGTEPRVFVLAQDDPLALRNQLELSDVTGMPWITADLATDGCDPTAWRDAWLVAPRPNGERPVIGAVARSIDEWREYAVAGRGISLCPASAESHYARPGLAFVPSRGVPPIDLCVAWRRDDSNPVAERFVEVVTEAVHRVR
jgi:DNA-binding transcriptional LysR family regulator